MNWLIEESEMGTKHRCAAAETRALDTYIKLRRAVNAVNQREGEQMRSFGLTESQFGVLEALLHLGPLCQRVLAAKVLKSAGNMTTVVDNLQRRDRVDDALVSGLDAGRARQHPHEQRHQQVELLLDSEAPQVPQGREVGLGGVPEPDPELVPGRPRVALPSVRYIVRAYAAQRAHERWRGRHHDRYSRDGDSLLR